MSVQLAVISRAAEYESSIAGVTTASGMNVADGAQIAEARRAMQFIADTEDAWENAKLQREKSPFKILSGPENRFWIMERLAADGTRFAMAFNCSPDQAVDVSIEPPGATPQRIELPPYSYKLLKFK